MRILHVVDSFAIGGAEQSLLNLARASRWDAMVAGIYRADTLRIDFDHAGARTFHLGLEQKWGFGPAVSWVRDIVRRERPDLIHAALYRAGMVARIVGLTSGVPVVDSFVNDSYGATRMRGLSRKQRARIRAIQTLDRVLARVPRLYISNSRAIAATNSIELGVPMTRIRVVPRGRDPSAFAEAALARSDTRRELGLSGPVVVHVGRFVEQKNHETLVDAFAALGNDARLLLVGEGPRLELVRARVRTLGLEDRVIFAGARRDVARLLAAGDVFAFPSRFEGWPGAVVEAMMAGVPVVASDLPVHREIDAGAGAMSFFPFGDANALSAKLRSLLEDPSKAAAQRERASERARTFTVEAMVEGHLSAYRDALGERR